MPIIEVSDLGEATYLSLKGQKFLGLRQINSSRVVFKFADSPEFADLRAQYLSDGVIGAYDFYNKLRHFKGVLMQERDRQRQNEA